MIPCNMRLVSIVWRTALIVTLVVGCAPASLPFGDGQASSAPASSSADLSAAGKSSDLCSAQPTLQLSALLSSFVTTAMPILSPYGPQAAQLTPPNVAIPAPSATPVPSEASRELEESIRVMRSLPKVDVHWQVMSFAPVGSGWLTLTTPDRVDGQG